MMKGDGVARGAPAWAIARSPEVIFVALMATVAFSLSRIFDLPFVWPSPGSLRFLSIHYLVPLIALVGWSGLVFRKRAVGGGHLVLGFAAFAAVMILHFNIKLWAPFINPRSFDPLYFRVDTAFAPIVRICFKLRVLLGDVVPISGQFYVYVFIAMFYASFVVHAVHDPRVFRKVLFATMLVHGLGALAYLAAPALGPFIYQQGVNPTITESQSYMLSTHNALVAHGRGWLRENGADVFLSPLAAMPSLHAAASAVFVRFAARYEPRLLVAYVPLFVFILIAAVANRFHYLADLAVGLVLALVCVAISEHVFRNRSGATEPVFNPLAWLAPRLGREPVQAKA